MKKETRSLTAPCCGATISYVVDLTAGPVRELIGCQACAAPLVFFVSCYANETYVVSVEVRRAG